MSKIKLIRLEDRENFYSEDSRDLMIEDDMLTVVEAAFMKGWDEAE